MRDLGLRTCKGRTDEESLLCGAQVRDSSGKSIRYTGPRVGPASKRLNQDLCGIWWLIQDSCIGANAKISAAEARWTHELWDNRLVQWGYRACGSEFLSRMCTHRFSRKGGNTRELRSQEDHLLTIHAGRD